MNDVYPRGLSIAILIDFLLVPFGIGALIAGFVALAIRNGRRVFAPGKRLLILSLSGYEAVKDRGIDHLLSFDNDFFDKVFFLCLGSVTGHKVRISPRLTLIDVPYPGWIQRMRALRLRYASFLFGEAYFLWWLYDFVATHRIGVIRSMEPHIMGLKGVLVKRLLGVTHIQDIRANFDLIYLGTGMVRWLPVWFPRWLRSISRKWERRLEGFVFRSSDVVFGGNKNNLDYAITCGAPLERSAVIRVNIQRDLFEDLCSRKTIRQDLGLAGKLLLYCGRLSPEKYPQDVLLSFSVLAYRREDVYLLLVGDGPEREELKELARKNGLGERVRFLGYRDNYFLKDLFISVDVIVCPLAGSVLIEAALAQLPIVAYDLEWHSELVIDRYSGMLVPFRDIHGLADATAFLLDRPEEAENCGKRAREIAFRLFHPDIIMEKEKTIYGKLLKPHNQPY